MTNNAGGMYSDSLNCQIRRDGLPMDAERAEYFEKQAQGDRLEGNEE